MVLHVLLFFRDLNQTFLNSRVRNGICSHAEGDALQEHGECSQIPVSVISRFSFRCKNISVTLSDIPSEASPQICTKVAPDLHLEIPIDDPSQVALHKEMLQSSSSGLKELKFSSDSVDFAFTEHCRMSEPKTVTL